ncbi:hypothetical protein [Microbacterium sp. P04]|uniref:hypothetical protein n=1 Tax=Microbacterium sp. P04 TaxID=3366947 RepID=UPI0037454CFE
MFAAAQASKAGATRQSAEDALYALAFGDDDTTATPAETPADAGEAAARAAGWW